MLHILFKLQAIFHCFIFGVCVYVSCSVLCSFTSSLECVRRIYWDLHEARTQRILQRHGSELHQGSSMCSAELHTN